MRVISVNVADVALVGTVVMVLPTWTLCFRLSCHVIISINCPSYMRAPALQNISEQFALHRTSTSAPNVGQHWLQSYSRTGHLCCVYCTVPCCAVGAR